MNMNKCICTSTASFLTLSDVCVGAATGTVRKAPPKNPNAPTLTKEGYFTVPGIKLLRRMTDEELLTVERFVIGREDTGEVMFLNPVDLCGVNLDSVIEIEKGKIILYPDSTAVGTVAATKPPPGEGLNTPAMLTFRRMIVKQKGDAKAVAKFRQKLIDHAAKIGAVFVHYEAETGIWMMKVDSF